jgi:hypothetical protein
LEAVSVEDLNDFIVTLKKGGMSPNTVLHNVIIIAQFCKRNGRSGITRQVQLPERISSLPREYTQEELAKSLAICDDTEVALFFRSAGKRERSRAGTIGQYSRTAPADEWKRLHVSVSDRQS